MKEDLARWKTEKEARRQRYREIFARVSVELIDEHYNLVSPGYSRLSKFGVGDD